MSVKIGLLLSMLTLSACNSLLPPVYDPVPENETSIESIDHRSTLAKMLHRSMRLSTSDVKKADQNQGEQVKKKRLSLPVTMQAIQAQQNDQNLTGIYPLPDGVQAFAVRNALIKNATHSLDLQYYSLHKGLSSRLLIRELVRAADRGVRIRILIDDMDTLGRDKEMTILAAHENIEVRIFNPIRRFRGTMLSRSIMFLVNIQTQHRRMHNKVWLADGVLGITGGRNIGDRYFNANDSDNFSDLDVLLGGAAVANMQKSFNQFWSSSNAIPVEVFQKAPQTETAKDIQKMILSTNQLTRKERVARHPYLKALDEAEFNVLPDLLPKLMWGQTDFYSDSSDKIETSPPHLGISIPSNQPEEKPSTGSQVLDALTPHLLSAKHEVIIANPYFLPGNDFIRVLETLVKKGVQVTVLTNSLESNDVPLVNGPYSRYRSRLLDSGVRLFELRGFPDVEKTPQWRLPIFSWQGSRAALHTKAAVIDGEISFVGSMNLDPRSVVWNTEVGVVSHQVEFAKQLRDLLMNAMSLRYSYAVTRSEKGGLEWKTAKKVENMRTVTIMNEPVADDQTEIFTREKGNFWRRLQMFIGAWVPETFL